MELKINLNKQNVLSAFIICCFISFLCIMATPSTQKIIDDIIPLAGGNVEAMFYVENSESGSITCVGDGLINSTETISNNESDAEAAVVSSPDYSAIVGNKLRIAWHSIKHEDGEYKVIGKLTAAEPKSGKDTSSAITVATVSDLPAATVKEGSKIVTKGFYSENDGGAAEYLVSTASASVDIPNASIPMSNGLYANLVYSDSINVKQVGARGDGATDDTALFTSVFAKAPNKSIYIPKGTYYLSETIFIPSGTTITGDGSSSVILACDGFAKGDDVFKINNSNNISISKINVNGNIDINTRDRGYSDRDGIHLLDIWNSKNIQISDCYFTDNVYTGIRLIGTCSDMTFNKTYFTNVDCGILALGSGAVSNVSITGCEFDGHKNSESISLFGTGTYSNITIDNNLIKNKTKGHAIFSANGTTNGIYITNNRMYDDCVGIYLKNATDVKIDNNLLDFSNCTDMNNGKGINLTSCNDVILTNNSISKTSQQGLYINGCSNVSATGNNIEDCGYVNTNFHAVDLRGSCTNVNLTSNSIVRNDSKLSAYSFVAHCEGSVVLDQNTFTNSKALLANDSSNLIMSRNGVAVTNQGVGNTITD